MSVDITKQLKIKLEKVLEELNKGEGFNLSMHPELPLLMLGLGGINIMSTQESKQTQDADSFEQIVHGPGQRITSLLAEVINDKHLMELAQEYCKTYQEILTRRKILIAMSN